MANKQFSVLAVFGQYACKEFADLHRGEKHTFKEWKKLASSFKTEDGDTVGICRYNFNTETEQNAFCNGIEVADGYFSDESYFAVTVVDCFIEEEAKPALPRLGQGKHRYVAAYRVYNGYMYNEPKQFSIETEIICANSINEAYEIAQQRAATPGLVSHDSVMIRKKDITRI